MKNIKKLILNKRLWIKLIGIALLYSASVLSYVWWNCYQSGLTGGRNGPLDAYRHTLASAVVSYTLSPKVVALITWGMERQNRPRDLMDQHNNAIGANIGLQASAFSQLERRVKTQILQGKINAIDAKQTTWREEEYWAENLFF